MITLPRKTYFALLALSLMVLIPVEMQAQTLPPLQDNGYGGYQDNSGGGGFQTYGQQPQTGYPQQQYQQQPAYGQQQSYGAPLQGRVSTAPAGTNVTASLSGPISSEFARVGDRFTATLGSPISGSDGSILLPAGSQLDAQVVMVRPAGRAGKNGELDVRFTGATLPNGQRVPLSAKIQTEDGTGVIKGGTTGGRIGRAALNTGVGAGLGAALGTAMGPLSGGEVGRGAIYGTAIGGGLGAAKAVWSKGKDAILQAGQPLNVTLDQPLTVSPATPSYGGGGYNNNYGGGYNNYGGQQQQYGY